MKFILLSFQLFAWRGNCFDSWSKTFASSLRFKSVWCNKIVYDKISGVLFICLFCIITAKKRSCGKVVFSVVPVCYSVHRGVSPCDHYSWCIGSHCTAPSAPLPSSQDILHGTSSPHPGSNIWMPSLETSSNLFIWGSPPQEQHLVVATEAHTVCKWATRILLECFLVS